MTDVRTGLPWSYGATAREERGAYLADRLLGRDVVAMTRAIAVAAPVEWTWRWVCQLAVAPYSYDLIDNFGRRSPRTLTPGAEALRVGQRFATVFRIVAVDPPRRVSMRILPGAERIFGPCAFEYVVAPDGAAGTASSRLVGRVVVPRTHGARHAAARHALAWGDLVMMRKQLRTLADLAQRSAAPSSE